MKFKKKPVVIDAVQIRGVDVGPSGFDGNPFSDNPEWLEQALKTGEVAPHVDDRDYASWKIVTLEDGKNGEAKHIATPGDWIIRGVKGELYFCKPDIFAATYDPVE
jgi:hypothetical protein